MLCLKYLKKKKVGENRRFIPLKYKNCVKKVCYQTVDLGTLIYRGHGV